MSSSEMLKRLLTEPPSDDVADMLKAWRETKGLTQAAAANILGVSARTLQGWELARPMAYPRLLQAAIAGRMDK
jgi:transcriptional regulator with XRE-family HTH domain